MTLGPPEATAPEVLRLRAAALLGQDPPSKGAVTEGEPPETLDDTLQLLHKRCRQHSPQALGGHRLGGRLGGSTRLGAATVKEAPSEAEAPSSPPHAPRLPPALLSKTPSSSSANDGLAAPLHSRTSLPGSLCLSCSYVVTTASVSSSQPRSSTWHLSALSVSWSCPAIWPEAEHKSGSRSKKSLLDEPMSLLRLLSPSDVESTSCSSSHPEFTKACRKSSSS